MDEYEEVDELVEPAGSDIDSDGDATSRDGSSDDDEEPVEDPLITTKKRQSTGLEGGKAIQIRIVPKSEAITDFRLHKPEASQIIALRAAQISETGIHFAKHAQGMHDPVKIATQELLERRCPLIVRRHMGLNEYEELCPREMALPQLGIGGE